MNELKIKLIYNGEKSLFNFLDSIKHDIKDNRFDKHCWSGNVKIEDKIFKEKEKDLANILFKIFFALGDKKDIPIEMNLWYKP